METNKSKVVIFGAGAVGSTVGGWLSPVYKELYFYDRAEVRDKLAQKGLTLYSAESPRETIAVQVLSDLSKITDSDIIIIAVKTYSLEAVSQAIRSAMGPRCQPLIVALQNGIENQNILPRYFTRIVYGIVSYNAWLDEVGCVGFQKKGPLIFGVLSEERKSDLHAAVSLLSKAVETSSTEHFQDAARSKMVINLTNSLTALIGHRLKPISDEKLFQKILTTLTFEGVQVLKSAGYRECKLGGMPSWFTIQAAAKLPLWMTRPVFQKSVQKMVLSSMAQDILMKGGIETELETLNGYFIELAKKAGIKIPYNEAIYKLCRERFGKPGFQPMDIREVWEKVQAERRL